ncbi:hypothetical protein HFO89_08640 [Rhizobium leguminosarum]|uniref:hypothetical protein n=1 Tax=Rhizobium leguminosarum TaxID=384 RepID=UPI001C95A0D6|nr:hypothetical protein [Rhizobium leguminosarum]MBY5456423.1 hypothetical protein [Rhizobium leguminosarum]
MLAHSLRVSCCAARFFVALSILQCLFAGIALPQVADPAAGVPILPLLDRTPLQRLTLCLNHLNTHFDASTPDPAGINAYPDYGEASSPELWQGCRPLDQAVGVSTRLRDAQKIEQFPALVFVKIGASQLPKGDYLNTIEALAHLMNLPENRGLRTGFRQAW